MTSDLRRRLRTRHLGWLLALVLWLPVAQWVAATHIFEHLGEVAGEADTEPKGLSTCATHVVAAALQAAAPVPPAVQPVLPDAAQDRPQPLPAGVLSAGAPLAYRSRAPPLRHA